MEASHVEDDEANLKVRRPAETPDHYTRGRVCSPDVVLKAQFRGSLQRLRAARNLQTIISQLSTAPMALKRGGTSEEQSS